MSDAIPLNTRVRVNDPGAPMFHRRTGRVARVDEADRQTGRPESYVLVFEGGGNWYGPFRRENLEVVPDTRLDLAADPRPQIERLADELRDDMECWVHEALATFKDVATGVARERRKR